MPNNAARYLGFAFASADLLFEIDPEGRIVFVMGAARRVLGMDQTEATSLPWSSIIADADHDLVSAVIESLSPADRRGPIRVELRADADRGLRRFAAFCACKLPQSAPNVSCVLTLGPIFAETDLGVPDGPHNLHGPESFIAATRQLLHGAQSAGLDLDLELIEMKGLLEASAGLADASIDVMQGRIAAAMRAESFGGQGAAKLGDEQYALVRHRADNADHLANRLERAACAAGAAVDASAESLALAPDTSPLHTMRALRFALGSFLKDGAGNAGAAFQTVLQNTVDEARAFTAAVHERRFQLVYQPVIEILTGELQHFETLVRLEPDKSPLEAIRMAEELELIESLDLAVIEQVVRQLNAKGSGRLKLAANISARSLLQPTFMPALMTLIAGDPGLVERLIFEITETAAFDDLDLANTAIQRIRQHGFAVCLDDFGSGAATMAYLRSLSVDAVKIDGQYVQDLVRSGRDSALVRHLNQLCRELGVETIAEQVETLETAEALAAMGVRYAQGWHFGKPAAEPMYQPPASLRVHLVADAVGQN